MTFADLEKALSDTTEVEPTTTGRKTGRESSRPVWFVQEAEAVYLLPVTGSDTQWYKNVVEKPTIRLAAAEGSDYTAEARPVTDPDEVENVVGKFREKYRVDDFEAYYPKHDVAVEVPAA
jgi:deazaflavin-dependent oxidoreductase (nitroreductase family)